MPLQDINIGTTANDGTGDDARTWAGKSNANFSYLENLINSLSTEVENAPYADMAALYADQGNQTTGKIQYVLDASAHSAVSSGARHFEYYGTTDQDEDDYRLLSTEESVAILYGADFRTFTIKEINLDSAPISTVDVGGISFEYNNGSGKVTRVIFNLKFSQYVADCETLGKSVSLKLWNKSTGDLHISEVSSYTTLGSYKAVNIEANLTATDLTVGNTLEVTLDVGSTSSGGSSLEYQTEITASTTLDGTQKGLNKVYPVNNASARTITITTGDYVENDVINIERRGQGSVEIIADTGVRIRGVRDGDNRYFINDVNSMVALLCRGGEEFGIIGNLSRGYTGAVTTLSYGTLKENDTAVDVTVIGTGFSSNMLVTVSANATLVSWTYVSNTEITLELTAVGVEDDTVTVTYDNGDVFVDTDAITIASEIDISDYTTWLKFEETSGTTATNEGAASDGTLVGGVTINQTGKVNKSYSFDGTDDYITFTDNLGVTAFPFTIGVIAKASALSGTNPIITTDHASAMSGFNLYFTNAKMGVLIGDGTGTAAEDRRIITTDNDVFSVDTWYIIDVVFNAIDDVDIYVDNDLKASTSSGTGATIDLTDTTEIGRNNRASIYADIELDEIKAWNRALTTDELTEKYDNESAGNPMV